MLGPILSIAKTKSIIKKYIIHTKINSLNFNHNTLIKQFIILRLFSFHHF